MITPPFIGACHSMMEYEVRKPRRVGSPTRHGGGTIRRGARFWLSFGLFCRLGGGDTSRWRSNASWQAPNTTWRARLAPFLAVLPPLSWRHVALEAQHDMAGAQCDMARFFGSLFGCFAAFEVESRRVGSPTRHGALPIRRGGRGTTLHCLFLGRLTQKSHLPTKSEVAGFMLIWFLVCLTCQLGH